MTIMMQWKFACLWCSLFISYGICFSRLEPTTRFSVQQQQRSSSCSQLHAIETYRTETGGEMSKVLSSFYRMVDRFKDYTSDDIDAVESERLRLLLEGGQEALTEPSVVGSFAVLYEDILPVRFGGDILFNLIDKTIKQSRNKGTQSPPKQQRISEKTEITKMSKSIIQSMLAYYQANDPSGASEKNDEGGYWFCEDRLFAEIDRNGDGVLTFEEFKDWVSTVPLSPEELGLPSKTDASESWSYMENIFSLIDVNNDGTLTPEEFKLWTTGSLSQSDDDCVVDTTTTQPTSSKTQQYGSLQDIPLSSPKAQRYRDRYLHMVYSFTLWEDKFKGLSDSDSGSGSSGSGRDSVKESKGNSKARLALIINGCFAGAKNPGGATFCYSFIKNHHSLNLTIIYTD